MLFFINIRWDINCNIFLFMLYCIDGFIILFYYGDLIFEDKVVIGKF